MEAQLTPEEQELLSKLLQELAAEVKELRRTVQRQLGGRQ